MNKLLFILNATSEALQSRMVSLAPPARAGVAGVPRISVAILWTREAVLWISAAILWISVAILWISVAILWISGSNSESVVI